MLINDFEGHFVRNHFYIIMVLMSKCATLQNGVIVVAAVVVVIVIIIIISVFDYEIKLI